MKKKTNLQTTEGGVAPRQSGPQKEKTQITIRVDTKLMNAAYEQMKQDNTRITDIVERGLILALTERNHQLPLWNKEVRFMVANATKDQQRLIRGLLIAMAEPFLLVDRKDAKVVTDGKQRAMFLSAGAGVSFTPESEKLFELVRWFLDGRNRSPLANEAVQYYSRYGKSPEEMAEMAELANL